MSSALKLPSTVCKLGQRALITLSGNDTLNFLHATSTNSIVDIAEKAVYTSFLNAQGKVLFDAFVMPTGIDNKVMMDIDKRVGKQVLSHLTKYKLRSNVEMCDVSDKYSVYSFVDRHQNTGKVSAGTVRDIQQAIQNSGGMAFADPRLSELGVRAVLPMGARVQLPPSLRSYQVGDEWMYDVHRLSMGVGEGAIDLPMGRCFPLECNLDRLNAVSFSKGCYIGQELTARTKYRGVTRKRLMPLSVMGVREGGGEGELKAIQRGSALSFLPDLPHTATAEEGVPLQVGSSKVGELRSAHGRLGIGLLRLEKVMTKREVEGGEAEYVDVKSDVEVQCQSGSDTLLLRPSVPFWWKEGKEGGEEEEEGEYDS